jgi:hypothetical protein
MVKFAKPVGCIIISNKLFVLESIGLAGPRNQICPVHHDLKNAPPLEK